MKIAELRRLEKQHTDRVADAQLTVLSKRKIGFTFDEAFDQHTQIIQSIVLEAILEINQHLSATETVRKPHWLDEQTFRQFLSKLSMACA